MRRPVLYWISVLLALGALVVNAAAWGQVDKSSRLKAQAIASAVAQHAPVLANPEAKALSANARILYSVGFALIILSLLCLVLALIRREPGWYLALGMLLTFACMAGMIL